MTLAIILLVVLAAIAILLALREERAQYGTPDTDIASAWQLAQWRKDRLIAEHSNRRRIG